MYTVGQKRRQSEARMACRILREDRVLIFLSPSSLFFFSLFIGSIIQRYPEKEQAEDIVENRGDTIGGGVHYIARHVAKILGA